jgi:hypothetical protein
MYKKHLLTFICTVLFCGVAAFEAKAGVYNSIVINFNPQTWQLSGSAGISVDYDTLADYNPNIRVYIKLGSAAGQQVSTSSLVYANNDPIATASTSYYAQANTGYFVTSEHALDCRYRSGIYWLDPLGYIQREPPLFTYKGSEFTVDPTNTPTLIPNTNLIYLGNTHGTYTTPSFNGAAAIDAVGFKGDVAVFNWATHASGPTQYDPGDQGLPIWTAAESATHTVAYTYSGSGSRMTLNARVIMGQVPPANARASIRARTSYGGPIVATSSNVPITYPVLTINDIPGNLGVIPKYNGSINAQDEPGFHWEISYDNGATWSSIGDSWHFLIFILRNPYELLTPVAFTDIDDIVYLYLYDYALQQVVNAARGAMTDEQVISGLSTYIYSRTKYNPNISGSGKHPLENLGGTCLCADFANMLTGLTRSAGVSAETTYIWGGDPATNYSNWFLVKHYITLGSIRYYTMRIGRPQHRDHNPHSGPYLLANPFFRYHAVTKLIPQNKYYDASYGLSDPGVSLDLLRSAGYSPSFTCNTSIESANLNRVLSQSWNRDFRNSNPTGAAIDNSLIPSSNTCSVSP